MSPARPKNLATKRVACPWASEVSIHCKQGRRIQVSLQPLRSTRQPLQLILRDLLILCSSSSSYFPLVYTLNVYLRSQAAKTRGSPSPPCTSKHQRLLGTVGHALRSSTYDASQAFHIWSKHWRILVTLKTITAYQITTKLHGRSQQTRLKRTKILPNKIVHLQFDFAHEGHEICTRSVLRWTKKYTVSKKFSEEFQVRWPSKITTVKPFFTKSKGAVRPVFKALLIRLLPVNGEKTKEQFSPNAT